MEITEKAAQEEEIAKETREEIYAQMESIDFRDVTFAYDYDKKGLKKESFCVKKGEFVALSGSSGIGKKSY